MSEFYTLSDGDNRVPVQICPRQKTYVDRHGLPVKTMVFTGNEEPAPQPDSKPPPNQAA